MGRLHIASLLQPTALALGIGANEKGMNTQTNQSSIAPGELHEVCMTLTPREQLRYAFTGSGKLSFNIHYHADNNVYFPVPERLTSGAKDSFTPASRQDYCLMWTNPGSDPVELHLEYEKRIGAEQSNKAN